MINYPVPFYENTSDNTHCFQASMKMVLKYFFPQKDFSWEELDRYSAKVDGKWTWPQAFLIWLSSQNVEIKNIEVFDFRKFVEKKEAYLFEQYGEEVALAQIKNSDIAQEVKFAQEFIEKIVTDVRIPTQGTIKELLTQKFLVCCAVNSQTLAGREGYSSHFVVVRGFDDTAFYVNDPGRPGVENRKIPFAQFEKAWAYPNDAAKNITAFRKK